MVLLTNFHIRNPRALKIKRIERVIATITPAEISEDLESLIG